jgi:hypothetical protein
MIHKRERSGFREFLTFGEGEFTPLENLHQISFGMNPLSLCLMVMPLEFVKKFMSQKVSHSVHEDDELKSNAKCQTK